MSFIRWLLGRLILAVNALSLVRDPAAQAAIDAATAHMALYQFQACPFCVKVRRHMRRHGLNIELRDIKATPAYEQELISQGGRRKVPCLRIAQPDGGATWLYESNDIIAYLNRELGLT